MPLLRANAVLVALTVGASGCATAPSWQPPERAPAELFDVPFVAQTTDQCGPAALSMLLASSGVHTSVATLRDRVYLPGRKGTLQVELMAATRESGRIAYVIDATPDALLVQLDEGRPVLVLQDLKLAWRSRWHYAVVVGYLPAEDAFVLRSGPVERLLVPRRRFLKSWQRGENWGLAVLVPGEIPLDASEPRYLRAVAAFESVNSDPGVISSYNSARARWPDSVGARFGLANAYYTHSELQLALPLFESIVSANPEYLAAHNNLALLYSDLGRREHSLETIEAAIGRGTQSPLLPVLLETRKQIKTQ